MFPDHLQIERVILAALECSVYVAPLSPGLTPSELHSVCAAFDLYPAEVDEARDRIEISVDYDTGKMLPPHHRIIPWLVPSVQQEPDYRDWRASEFVHKELKTAVRQHGVLNAKIERSTLVERGSAAGLDRLGLQAAITIDQISGHFAEVDGLVSYVYGHEKWPLPSEQRKQTGATAGRVERSEVRRKAFSIVRDKIERRTDGRPSDADVFEAFIDRLDELGVGKFRLWWRQTVDEIADSDDPGQRFRLKPDADSDPRRTVIPMIPSKVVVDVVMGSGGRLGVKHDRLGGPFAE